MMPSVRPRLGVLPHPCFIISTTVVLVLTVPDCNGTATRRAVTVLHLGASEVRRYHTLDGMIRVQYVHERELRCPTYRAIR